MSKADELATKLKQTRHISADQVIDSWPGQVYELYHHIESWLLPLIEVGLILRRNPTHVCESDSSATYDYAIDQLLIEGNNHNITFDPVARFTDDGAGRVEIHSKGKELALLRTVDEHGETHWWLQAIEQAGQQLDAVALTEHNLLAVVQEGLGL
ncbi:hypothetical protein [Pseudomonas sp.]|uniref:hypothetical protein n=1 Tax=Pseudomonas sp. TaxID=306 RepID=UPI003F3D4F41